MYTLIIVGRYHTNDKLYYSAEYYTCVEKYSPNILNNNIDKKIKKKYYYDKNYVRMNYNKLKISKKF